MKVNFWYKIDKTLDPGNSVSVQWSTNGLTWSNLISYSNIHSGGWTYQTLNLPVGAEGKTSLKIRFSADIDLNKGIFRADCVEITGAETAPACIDADGDGYGTNCTAGTDCDDTKASVHPGAAELCDGLDNDCDGLTTDDGTSESWYGQATSCGAGTCAASGTFQCVSGVKTDTCSAGSGNEEICNGIDDDCDGPTDEDLDAPDANYQEGVCAGEVKTCDGSDGWLDADYTLITGYEEVEVTCDGLDNDCDGAVDESLEDEFYADADGDGYGDADNKRMACEAPTGYVSNNTDCDDTNGEVHEDCGDEGNNDRDGDGIIDENDNCISVSNPTQADADSDGIGDVCDTDDNSGEGEDGDTDNNDDDQEDDGDNGGNNENNDNDGDNQDQDNKPKSKKWHTSHGGGRANSQSSKVIPQVAGATIDLDDIERQINEIRAKVAAIAAQNGSVLGAATEVKTGVLD